MEHSAEDGNSRTLAVTTFILTLCQLAGKGLTHRMPSVILVAPDGPDGRSIVQLATNLTTADVETAEQCQSGEPTHIEPPKAEARMAWAAAELESSLAENPHDTRFHRHLRGIVQSAKGAAFGRGSSRRYTEAWHNQFGLITEHDNRLVLRLDTEDDSRAFREDVVQKSRKIIRPEGYGISGKSISKMIGVSGAITPEQWDADFTEAAFSLPSPLIFLPQSIDMRARSPDSSFLAALASTARLSEQSLFEEPVNFSQHPWFAHYAKMLRQRLSRLPGDFEHAFQRMGRQLFPACLIFVGSLEFAGETQEEIEALALDLAAHTMRGVTIGIAGLAWHGMGIYDHNGPWYRESCRVLKYLRKMGPMTISDLNRRAHIKNKEVRDILVSRFAKENLVRIEGKVVRQTGFDEFVHALYDCNECPLPPNFWSKLHGGR